MLFLLLYNICLISGVLAQLGFQLNVQSPGTVNEGETREIRWTTSSGPSKDETVVATLKASNSKTMLARIVVLPVGATVGSFPVNFGAVGRGFVIEVSFDGNVLARTNEFEVIGQQAPPPPDPTPTPNPPPLPTRSNPPNNPNPTTNPPNQNPQPSPTNAPGNEGNGNGNNNGNNNNNNPTNSDSGAGQTRGSASNTSRGLNTSADFPKTIVTDSSGRILTITDTERLFATSNPSGALPTSSAGSTPSGRDDDSSTPPSSKPPTVAIGLGVALGVIALLATIGVCWFCRRRRRRNVQEEDVIRANPVMLQSTPTFLSPTMGSSTSLSSTSKGQRELWNQPSEVTDSNASYTYATSSVLGASDIASETSEPPPSMPDTEFLQDSEVQTLRAQVELLTRTLQTNRHWVGMEAVPEELPPSYTRAV